MQNIYNLKQDEEEIMKEHIELDELSAYLDDEAANVSVLESHLDTCDFCRDELSSLQSLSQRMQELPEPEVHPAFATRVLATITEEQTTLGHSTRGRSGILRWVYGLAPVAVVATLFVAISLNTSVDTPDGIDIDSAQSTKIASILKQDEEALFDELSAHFANNTSSDSIVVSAYHVSTPNSAQLDTTLLTLALNDSKVRSPVDQQWRDSKDVRTTINHLNAEESNFFKQMLMVHAQEALLGEASFEG